MKMIKKGAVLLFLAIPALLLLSACSLAADITPPPGAEIPTQVKPEDVAALNGSLYPLLPPDVIEGEAIYQEKCAPCHGPGGLGDGSLADRLPEPVPAIGDPILAHQSTPSEWYRIVTEGKMEKQMPPFASLSDQERWNVVAFVYTLSSSTEVLEQGEELYVTYCASCHGESGSGDGTDASGLAQSPTDLRDLKWIASRSSEQLFQVISNGMGENMPGYADQLSDEDMWALSDYLRSLSLIIPGANVAAESSAEIQQAGTTGKSVSESGGNDGVSADVSNPTGTINGTIVNLGSEVIPDGLEILLHGFDGMQVAYTRTVQLDDNLEFLFDEIPLVPGRAYLATTQFEGVTYGSDISLFEDGQQSIDLPIEVFGSTTDASGLIIERLHLFLEPVDETTIRVVALYILSNPGNQVVVARNETEPVIEFHLPAGAQNIEFKDGELGGRFVSTSDGFGDLASIRPGIGSHQILLAYDMALQNKLDLNQKMDIPVNAVVVLVPEDGLDIRGKTLQDAGIRDVDGFSYHTYNGAAIGAGGLFNLTINKARTFSLGQLSTGSSMGLLIGIGVLGVALVIAGIFLFRRNQEVDEDHIKEEEESPPFDMETKESIIDAILALDDLYKAGELPEEAYLKRREELKDHLRKLNSLDNDQR